MVGLLLLLPFFANRSYGQTNPTAQSIPYTQAFTGVTTTYPAGWQGWTSAFAVSNNEGQQVLPMTADKTMISGNNSSTTNSVYSFSNNIGLLNSGSAMNALCLAVVTTGSSNIRVVYDAATQGQTSAGRIDKFALQYRVGTSGNFTDVNGTTYQNNASATTSGSTASNVVTISVILPAACNNQSVVQLRWIYQDMSGSGGRPSFSIDNVSVSAVTLTNFYSKSSGNLDATGTWGTNTNGTGTAPSDFTTVNQVFHIANSNSGGISGSNWTVSGLGSKVIVDSSDLTISSSKPIIALIDVAANRTLTLSNTTLPTFGELSSAGTVKFSSLSYTASSVLPNSTVFGGVIFDNTSVLPATNSAPFLFTGNFTLQNSASFYGGDTTASGTGYNLIVLGSANQTITGNNLILACRNFSVNDNNSTANPTKAGTLSLASNTNLYVCNSITTQISTAGNAFSDGGNTIKVYNNISMGGASAGYNLTGTMSANIITSGTLNIRGYTAGAASSTIVAAPVFKNININSTGTAVVAFCPTTGANTYTIGGNFNVAGVGTGAINFGGNTIQIGGNFTYVPTSNVITFTGSTVQFNGAAAQNYSSNVATTGNAFVNLTMNNTNGLTLFSPLTVSGVLTLTSGKIRTLSNTMLLTSTTAGNVSGGSSTSYVNGALSKVVPSAGATRMLFEVGDTTYSPVTLGLNASATAGTIKVRSAYGSHPQIVGAGINPTTMTNRYWSINLTAVTAGAYPMLDTFSYSTGDINGGSNTGFIVRRYDNTAATWSTVSTVANYTTLPSPLMPNGTSAAGQATTTATIDYVAGKTYPVPTISSVSPNTGNPGSGGSGTAVTITGTNFNTTAGNNVVYFGATKATVSSVTGSTILNVTVPIGATYASVSVTNIAAGLSAYYNPPFKPSFNNAGFIADTINIKPKVDFNSTTANSSPYGGAIGDIDGDGKADLVVNNVDSSSVSIFLNTSSGGTINTGSFTLYSRIAISSKPNNVKLADIDGDGKLDIVCAINNNTNVAIVRNTTTSTGSPTFASVSTASLATIQAVVAIADFDGDGKADIAVTLPGTSAVGILLNTSSIGAISFAAVVNVAAGSAPNGVATADFNGDNRTDIVAVNAGGNSVSVFQNNSTSGSLSFGSAVTLSTGSAPIDVQTADIDADGKMDILFTNSSDATFSVIRNQYTSGAIVSGSFASRVNFTTGTGTTGLAVADLNGDSKLDVVVSNAANTISVFRNTTTGSTPAFTTKVDYATGSGPTTVTLGDLDGDKFTDIVVGNKNDRTVSVFENYPLPYVPAITGATSLCADSTATLADSLTGGIWASSATGIATINPTTGVVTGISAGVSTISYSIVAGGDTNYVTRSITVNAHPTVGSITGTTTVCPSVSSTLSSSFSGGTGTWSSSATSIATINPTTGVMTGVAGGTATITFTVTGACGTVFTTTTATVTTSPSAGTITGTTTVCTGATTTLSDGIAGGVWSSSAAGVATVDASGVVTGVTAGSATISYTVTNSCGTATASASVTVNTVPSAPASITGTTTLCATTTSTLSDATGGGTWSSSATSIATVDASGVVTGVAGGTVTISYTVTNSCGSTSATTTVTINPLPTTPAAITGTTTVCTAATTTLADTTSGATWSSSATGIATVDASGVVTGVAVGTVTISYTVTNSCGSSSATATVTVITTPSTPAAITGTTTVCTSATTTLADATSGGTWSSSATGVATIDASGVVTGLTVGSATITYTVSNTCGSAFNTTSVTVITIPATPAAITGTTTVCTAASTTLASTTSGGTWSSSASGVATVNPSTGAVTGVTVGSATITYTVSNSCGSAFVTTSVTVNTVPATPASITGTTTVAIAATTTLSDATSGGAWTSSATSIATISSGGVVTGVAAGSATITYTVTNACGSAFTTASVTITSGSYTAGNLVVLKTIGTTSASTAIRLMELSTAGSVVDSVSLPTSGGSQITMSGSATSEGFLSLSGEKDRIIVTGYDATTGVASIAGTASASTNRVIGSVTYTKSFARNFAQSVYSANNIRGGTAYNGFYFATGSNTGAIRMNDAATLSSTSTNQRSMAIFNGCLYYAVAAGTGVRGIYQIGTGISSATGQTATQIANQASSGGAESFSISPDGNILYIADGTNGIVKFTRTGGAGSFTAASYTVYATTCGGITVDYTTTNPTIYTTLASGTSLVKFQDAGSTVSSVSTIYTAPAGTLLRGVVFAPTADATVTATAASVCSGGSTTVTFRGNPHATVTYNINGGTSQTIVIDSATGTASVSTGTISSPATYNLVNIIVPSGTKTLSGSTTINILTAPVVPAITGTTTVCAGATTALADTATGGTWSSATTAVATVNASGVVSGVSGGTSVISYSKTNSCGTTVVTTTVTVTPLPVVAPVTGATTLCSGATTTLADTTSGGTWSSSATGIATVDASGVVYGVSAGSVTITYTVTNSCGSAYSTLTLTVNSGPVVGAVTGTTAICTGSTSTLADTTAGGTWTSSATAIATVSASGVVTGVTAGSATISYTVTNSCGSTTQTASVTVTATPTVGAITGPSTVCVTGTISLSDTTAGGTWSSSATSIATVNATGNVYGVAVGSTTISYGVVTSCGTIYATSTVSVITAPTIGAITGATHVCTSATTTLSDTTLFGTWTSSAPSVASINSSTGVVTGVSAGTATITYSVGSACGTSIVTYPDTVFASPSVSAITGVTPIIVGQIITAADATSGGTWSVASGTIANISSGGVITGLAGGTTTVSYTITNACGSAVATASLTVSAAMGAGNIAVLQANDTTANGSTISIVEYGTTAGSPLNTFTLPSTGASPRLVMSGTASSEGSMSLDSERTHIILPGYDTTAGTTAVASNGSVFRAIFSMLPTGAASNVVKLSQTLVYNTNNFRGATAAGTKYFGAGTASTAARGGVQYMVGTTSSTQVTATTTNVRTAQVFNGQLYYSTGSGTVGVYAVGTGVPTTSGNTSTLINSTGSLTSPYGFSVSPDANTLYVADDAQGIYRFTRSGGTGTFASATQINALKCRGIAVDYTTTPYTIYATTATGTKLCTSCNPYSDSLIKIVDGGAGSSYTLLAAAPVGKNFRGVSFTPTPKASITVTSGFVCSGSSDTVIIYGNPGATVNYSVNGTPTSTTIDGSGRKLLASVYTNATSGVVSNTYVLTSIVTSLGTFTASGSANINVNPALVAAITGTSTICNGDSITVAVTGGTPGAVVTLSPGAATFTLNGSGNGSVRIAPSATTTYTATVSLSGCTASATGSVIITVNPLPTASISGTTSIFLGASTSIVFTGTPGAVVYYTSTGGSTTDSVTLDGSGNYSLTVTPTGTTTYSLISVRSTLGCTTAATGSAIVTVTALPYANIIGTATICAGASTNIIISGTPGASVVYTYGSFTDSVVLSASGFDTISVTPLTTTTYTLTHIRTSSYSGTLSGSITVTVVPTVTAGTLSGATTICAADTSVIYSSTTGGGAWSTSASSVASVNTATGRIYAVSAGTATITYIVSNSCFADTARRTVTINPLPTATISGTTSIMLGASTPVIFAGTANATVTYTINGGSPLTVTLNASGADTLVVSPTVTSTYALVSVTSTAGCTSAVSGNAVVTVVTPFSKGNLVVLRPEASTNNATNVSVVQYDTSGTLVSVTAIPSTGASKLTISGTATSEGLISLSAERDRLVLVGYDVALGTTGSVTGIAANRVIGTLNPLTTFTRNFSQNVYSGNNIRSGLAYDTNLVAGGANTGLMLMNNGTTNISSTVTNTRYLQVYNGQLYFSTGSATLGIYRVGSVLPTTAGTTAVNVARTGTGTSPYGFSISPDGLSLFVADDGATRGIRKFTRASTSDTFLLAYTVLSNPCVGVAVDYSVSPYIVYATTRGSGSGVTAVDSLIKMRDGAGATLTRLATSPTGNPFRGLAFAPAAYGSVALAGAASICNGASSSINFIGNPYGKIKYHVNAGTIQTATLDSTGSVTITTGALSTTTGTVTTYTYALDSILNPSGYTALTGTAVVTVNPTPVITAITSSSDTLCAGGTLSFTATTVTGSGGVIHYAWSGPSAFASTLANPSITTTLASAGVYSLVVTDTTTGCVSGTNTSNAIVVNGLPTAGTITATPASTCVGSLITLTETGTISGTGTLVSYNWSGPGGYSHTGTSATDTFTAPSTAYSGVYSLTVTYSGAGCTSGAVVSSAITVNAAPTAYSVTGGGAYCGTTGVAIGLSSSDTGVSYQLYFGASTAGSPVAGTGSAISFGAYTGIGTYTVMATGPGGCSAVAMTGSATIADYTVGITVGANPSVCQPTSSATLSYSSPTGSPSTYSIVWNTRALADGFSNVSGATLGATIPLSIPTGADTVYGATITVSNGTCTSVGYNPTLTVYAHPTATITSAVAPCSGYATNVVFTGTPRATITYRVDGGSSSTAALSSAGTYSLGTGAITSAHTYYLLDAHNPVCSTTLTDSIIVTPIPMHWVGGTSTDWNTASNWSCGFVPGAGDDVTIDTGTANRPSIATSGTGTVRSLTLIATARVTLNSGAILNVKGNMVNNGTITGAGKVKLNNTSAQTITGIGTVNNLNLNNSAGATIGSASRVTVKGILSVTTGALATGDSLVLYADSAATARVDSLPAGASITGQAKVMVYVPGGRRAYRFWSHPFSNYIGLSQVQNYIDVTGAGGSGNGFTTTASNAPSAFRYNPLVGNSALGSDPGWRPFTSAFTTADSNRLHRYQGMRLFFRGAKDSGLGYTPYTPQAVSVAQWGTLNQGTQTVTLSKGSSSGQDYNMIGNPYASPVDIGTVIHNALVAGTVVGPSYFVWNPSLGAAGQFQAQFINTTTAVPYYIQACNSFQVHAAYNGSTLTFNENNKGATPTANLFKAAPEYISLKVYDANYHPYDMLYVQFNENATDDVDSSIDATKPFGGADLNFYSLTNDEHKMIIDARKYDTDKVIPLGITAQHAQDYIIKAETVALPTGGELYLHDKLLKQYVKLDQGAEYRFAINSNLTTQGNNRFELTMKPAPAAPSVPVLKVAMTPNPATDEVQISFTQSASENVAVRLLDLSGVSVYNKDLGIQQNGSVTVPLSKFAAGIYMVELTSGNQKVVQRLIKE